MKVGMRTPSLKKSIKAQTTGKVKRAVKKSVSPGYGQKGVGWIKDPKKAAYNKVYNKTTLGVGDVYRGIGGNGSRSSSNSSFSGSAAEIPEVRIPSKLEKVLTSSEKKKYISLVQTGCVLDQDRDAIIKSKWKTLQNFYILIVPCNRHDHVSCFTGFRTCRTLNVCWNRCFLYYIRSSVLLDGKRLQNNDNTT